MGDSDFKKKDDVAPDFQRDKRRRRTVTVEPVGRTPRNDGDRPTHTSRVASEQRYERSEKPSYSSYRDRDDKPSYSSYRDRDERPAYSSHREGDDRPARRSYNPNFSSDNRFLGGSKPSAGDRYEKPERNFNRWDSPSDNRSERSTRPYEKKSYGNREGDYERKSYGDRPAYGDKPYGNRTPSDRPYQPRDKKFGKPFVKNSREGVMDPGMKPAFYPSYTVPHSGNEIRLNRFIAMSGKCSRREADEYILAGDVTVNGEVVTTLGYKIAPTDTITFKGKPISSEKKVYILMNKPKGYVTSIDDPHAEKTVMDIVKNACDERIYPVGRLDKSSVGVLLLTNDGDLTERLTHPSHNKRKVYQVTLDAPLTNFDLARARDGIDLDDGIIIPDAVDFVKPDNRKEVGIEIHSGRNRIVRRIFEELGYGVHKLDRVYFAGLTKKNLKRGQWRFLTDREVAMLKSGRYE
jgi:23S rRNA pseudouridine2605 synthase